MVEGWGLTLNTLLVFYLNYSVLEYNFRYQMYLQSSDVKKDVYEEEMKI